jgi:hypothetical protein
MEDSLSTSSPKTNQPINQPTNQPTYALQYNILQNMTVAQLFDKLITLGKKK